MAIGYAVYNLINTTENSQVLFNFGYRRVSTDVLNRMMESLADPPYEEALMRLEGLTCQPLKTGAKSWREILEAEEVLRREKKPPRLSESIIEILKGQRPEALNQKVPLLHTCLIDLEKNPDREVWKVWIENKYKELGFKDNKGQIKRFLTGDEQWQSLLNSEQTKKIRVHTDRALWAIGQLKQNGGFDPNVDCVVLALAMGIEHQDNITLIDQLIQVYYEQKRLPYTIGLSDSQQLTEQLTRLSQSMVIQSRSAAPTPSADTSSSFASNIEQLRGHLRNQDNETDPSIPIALDAFIRELNRHRPNLDVAGSLNQLVIGLTSIRSQSTTRYSSDRDGIREQLRTFIAGDGSSANPDMQGNCLTGILGRLQTLNQRLCMGRNLTEYVTTEVSNHLRASLQTSRDTLGGQAENSMHLPFVTEFLAQKNWTPSPATRAPYTAFRSNFDAILRTTWQSPSTVITILNAIHGYYQDLIQDDIKNQNQTHITMLLKEIQPGITSESIHAMHYQSGTFELNMAAFQDFLMENLCDIAIRNQLLARRQ